MLWSISEIIKVYGLLYGAASPKELYSFLEEVKIKNNKMHLVAICEICIFLSKLRRDLYGINFRRSQYTYFASWMGAG